MEENTKNLSKSYQIFTDATADLTDEPMAGLVKVEIIPMQVEIGGNDYIYGPGGNITVDEFYGLQKAGNFATTSQINPDTYLRFFEPCLKAGKDIIYLCFSSGLSSTIQSALICIEELREKYPERKIVCIDTLCASLGEGFFVREAARKQTEGLTFDELVEWANDNRLKVCHWFTVDIFDHLKHGGRVSATAAAVGTMLQIKPLLHVDTNGKLEVVGKPRGRKKAIELQISKLKEGWLPELGKLIIIGHGACPDGAQQLKAEVEKLFPDAEVYTMDIGPIIGAHTGPGMLAVLYWGSTR